MNGTMEAPANTLAKVEKNELAPRRQQAVGSRGVVISSFEDLWRMSQAISKSGLAPKGITTPEAIFTAVQLGLELGLSPMAALQSIAIINGKPSIYGDAALALVRGSGLCEFYTEFPSNNQVHALADSLAVSLEFGEADEVKSLRKKIAELSAKMNREADDFGYTSISKRVNGINSMVRRFTIRDAKIAGLFGKAGPWVQYPERMLMWRSRGFNLRDNFGDVLKGMYTQEEAQDIGGGQQLVTQVSSTTRTQAVLDKIKNPPLSEGQTFEPDAENVATIEKELAQELAVTTSAETEQAPELDVAGDETAPPEGAEAVTSWESFLEAMNAEAQAAGVSPSALSKQIGAATLAVGKKGKGAEIPADVLQGWMSDFKAGTGHFQR